jgi:glucan phosphoethanolaminetransferase (alkaline phosphatase superfamily)
LSAAAISRRVALDVAIWLAAPAITLILYIERYLAPADAVLPHVRLVFVPFFGLTAARLLAAATLSARTARLLSAIAAGALLFVLLAYYALLFIGLDSWGRVISWDLITSYSREATQFVEALGLSVPIVLGIALFAYVALAAGAWAYLSRFDWCGAVVSTARPGAVALVIFSTGATCAIETYRFSYDPAVAAGEPVSLTLHPQEADFQGHGIDRLRAARLDSAENDARAAYRPAAAAPRRNVFLIVVDALRVDHMGIFGYARDTTPHLARLEQEGRLRKAAAMRSVCASSVCGLIALGSSRYVHDFSEHPITLQEVLRRNGYAVHMILSGNHLGFYGLKDAYGALDSYYDAQRQSRRYMNDDALVLDRLESMPAFDGKPVMIQFHLMSTHLLGQREAKFAKFAPAANYALFHSASGKAVASAVNYYDNGVLQTDAVIARILGVLREKGYLEDAIVAITADHGEALGEHGYVQHGNSVREQVLRIPFVLLSYGAPLSAIPAERIASQIDIAPTILAELKLPAPSTWRGTPLQQPLAHDFLHFQERWDIGIVDARDAAHLWKYWLDTRGAGEYAYDLLADPGEDHNRIDSVSAALKREWRLQVLESASTGVHRRWDQDGPPLE